MLGVLNKTGDFVKKQSGKTALALATFFGAVSAFSLPPYPFVFLFFISLPLMLLLVGQAKTGRRAFVLGLFFGFGYFGVSIYWVGHSFLGQTDVPQWTAPFAVALLVAYLSLFPAIAFMITNKAWGSKWGPRALIFAGVYSGVEWLRGYGEFSFPWNITSSIWWQFPEMMQGAALVGGYGLGALTLLAAGLFVGFFEKTVPGKDRVGMILLGTLVLGSLALLGWARLDAVQIDYHESITLRLVQANIPQIEKWDPDLLQSNLDKHIQLSMVPDASGAAITYVIWPEVSIPYNVEDSDVRAYLASGLGGDKTLVSGANRFGTGDDIGNVYNSIYALGPTGQILDVYDKNQLVPFGEYVPFQDQLQNLGLGVFVPGAGGFARGTGLKTMTLPGLPPFSPLVCYEIIYPGNVVPEGENTEWLLNLTNDAWFGITPGPYQHFETARMRAIEEGIPVVRVSSIGISGVVDPLGRITSQLSLGQTGYLDVRLPKPILQKTPYSVYGSVIFLVLLFILNGFGMIIKGGPKQDRRQI